MTLYQFRMLNDDDQLTAVWDKGDWKKGKWGYAKTWTTFWNKKTTATFKCKPLKRGICF